MNHAANTPGHDYRSLYVFTIKDGTERAYIVSDCGGRVVLVPTSFELAKSQVEKGLADEAPQGTVRSEQDYGRQIAVREQKHDCSCKKAEAGIVDVSVAAVQKTETVVVGRGRLVSGTVLGEPIMAVAEPSGENNVASCCDGVCEGSGTPKAIIIDRYGPAAGGGYAVTESKEHELPSRLSKAYAKKEPQCLPWVRVQRDPENFRACLQRARSLGKMDDSRMIFDLVGPYLAAQDQEVFITIQLDPQLQIRSMSEIARGHRDQVDVPVPDALRVAIVEGATAVVVCHNHPSGVVMPSDSDIELTKTLKKAFEDVRILFLDHVIVGADKFYSFAKEKRL